MMRQLTRYFVDYFRDQHKPVLITTTLVTALLVTGNYTLGVNATFAQYPFLLRTTAYFFLFAFAFSSAYLLQLLNADTKLFATRYFFLLLIAAPLLFALKVSFNGIPALVNQMQYPWDEYYWTILKWPLKCLLVITGILMLVFVVNSRPGLPGLNYKVQLSPYFLLILLMIPLILLAATNPDFLRTYPKVKNIDFILPYTGIAWPYQLFFELSYGLDFFTIELFFRGFLVLCFIRFAGKEAILPMAVFYCTIHFGKPLGECITSYFGGILLGVVTYHTGSIYGGLVVHLGIAWMMELVASLVINL
jgi:hypothetical protein